MATWHSRGLRGSTFEELINRTNDLFAQNQLCLIQKVPTPITPIRIDQETRHITLAYFDKKSTVDYIGVVQGIPVCFDAKECHSNTFALQNVHEHQIGFMEDFERQQGIAFILIYFMEDEQFYYLRFSELQHFWKRAVSGGRKSIRREELDERFFFRQKDAVFVPYLDALQLDLTLRDET